LITFAFEIVFYFERNKDILKWTPETSKWVKVSQTPALTKFHALSFTGKPEFLVNLGNHLD
jgi:hypothetical protein